MSGYTKGPWQHLGDPDDEECRVRQTESVRNGVGFCSEITICENIRSKANASLIAAAPELFEALEMAMEIGDQCSRGFLGKFQVKAKAALDKARGTK
jgi:hypothetical protein